MGARTTTSGRKSMRRTAKRSSAVSANRVAKTASKSNGKAAGQKKAKKTETVRIVIPPLKEKKIKLTIVGDSPLMTNNKFGVGARVADQYGGPGGKTGSIKPEELTPEEMYAAAFYVLPDSKHDAPHPKGRYGIPASGIFQCFCSAIRCTGINDNTTIGLMQKSFRIFADCGGLCLLQHKGFEMDKRLVNIGAQKTVPQWRYRPLFYPGWKIVLAITFNMKILTEESLVNLAQHAGQYIGLCELRKEKKQGECGGFIVG